MSDLVDFLRQRLDEDEQAARNASPSLWKDPGEDESDALWLPPEDAYHIYRWEPERVLAEVEAKRRIIERHRVRDGAPACTECGGFEASTHRAVGIIHHGYVIPWPCPTLRMLAQVYAGHPEFKEEWRP